MNWKFDFSPDTSAAMTVSDQEPQEESKIRSSFSKL